MPQVDLLREPFLPPDHEAALIQYSAVLGGLDLPSRSGIPFEEKFEESMGDLREPSLFVARQGWSSRGVATTPESLESKLQVIALSRLTSDAQLAIFNRSAALGAGIAQAAGDEQARQQLTGLGHEIINFRATHALYVVLGGFNYVHSLVPAMGTGKSAWEQADQAHDKAQMTCPADLDDEIIDAFSTSAQAAPFLAARSKKKGAAVKGFAKLGRVGFGVLRKELQSDTAFWSPDTLRTLYEGVVEALPEQPAIDHAKIRSNMRTAREFVKCLGFAALTDPDLASDPTVRFFAYVTDRFRAYDVTSEAANFDRQVVRIARKEAKAGRRGGSV